MASVRTPLLLLLLVAVHAQGITVMKNAACTCAQILSQADCNKLGTACLWNTTTSTCASSSTSSTTKSASYCSTVSQTACPTTKGCAYPTTACVPFAGCTAYVGATQAACQAINIQCNSNGTYCTDPQPCTTYKTQAICTTSSSTNGLCMWGTACREPLCSDAPTTLTTNLQCAAFLPGCLTFGAGCASSPLPACATRTGDITTCATYIGSDGNCTGTTGGTKCSAVLCTSNTTATTNAACAAFQTGCVTNGAGCVPAPLGTCSTFKGNQTTCQTFTGSDGPCDGTATGTTCNAALCSLNTTATTNAQCAAWKSGCVTNGKGCVSTLTACAGNQGTTSTCVGYIGTDGPCKGQATATTTAAACAPLACSDSPTTNNTNALCAAFLTGCITNGNGCVLTLGLCASYSGTGVVCTNYIGSDGNCTGSGTCTAKSCTDTAANTLTTAASCAAYTTNCTLSQTGTGCVLAASCSALSSQTACGLMSGCAFSTSCMSITSCGAYSTQALCNNNPTSAGGLCYWVGSSCVARQCTYAPAATYNTQALCQQFMSTCLYSTTSSQCLDSTSCGSYQGDKVSCEALAIKTCTNTTVGTSGTCQAKACGGAPAASTTNALCQAWLSTCLTLGTSGTCTANTNTCTVYSGTYDTCATFVGNSIACSNSTACAVPATCSVSGATSSTCSNYWDSNGIPCFWNTGSSTCVQRTCPSITTVPSQQTDCTSFMSSCTLTQNSSGTNICIANTTTCTGMYGTSTTCPNWLGAYTINSKTYYLPCVGAGSSIAPCVARQCIDLTSPTSQSQCNTYHPSCNFAKTSVGGTSCIYNTSTCASYYATVASDCTSVIGIDNGIGNYCGAPGTLPGNCVVLACASATGITTGAQCLSYMPKTPAQASNFCQINQAGTGCITAIVSNCTSVTSASQAVCQTIYNTTNQGYCTALTTGTNQTCAAFSVTTNQCSTISTPANAAACTAQQCRFSYTNATTTTCIPNNSACTAYNGIPSFCQSVMAHDVAGTNSTNYMDVVPCWYTNASAYAACKIRACSDNTTSYTDAECIAFSKGWAGINCKWNGTVGCTNNTAACSAMNGTPTSCAQLSFSTITGVKCLPNNAPQSSATCTTRTCTDNGIATTNAACATWLTGCVTNGAGCILATQPCTAYQGTQIQCQAFTGNSGTQPCNAPTATALQVVQCQARTCADNTTATTNAACAQWLTGCVTTGSLTPGCIANTSPCSSYTGTTATCALFSGMVGSQVTTCTNAASATATTACVPVTCTSLTLTTNALCQAASPQCVTNGTTCINIQACASFTGDMVSCLGYQATDGPCKGTAAPGSTAAACVASLCTDAPNSNNTDALCAAFKTGCVTNGYGCVTPAGSAPFVPCPNFLSQSNCQAQTGCGWINQCVTQPAACSTYTIASLCQNSTAQTGFGCAWVYSTSTCRAATCEDQNSSNTTEALCVAISPTCTTSGAGCVTRNQCNLYTTSAVCSAATAINPTSATAPFVSCTWDLGTTPGSTLGCRQQQCKDAPATNTTNALCNTYLSGCVTNGAGCMTSTYTCSGWQSAALCLQDSNNNPCLWLNNTCYPYTKCQDLNSFTTPAACQLATSLCTSNGTSCIPQNLCASYTKQISCVAGTDGACGWVASTSKCQLFSACSDIKAVTQTACATYNSGCTSDGTNCIQVDTCSNYLTQTACATTQPTPCFWDKTALTCRQVQCTDVAGKTQSACAAVIATTTCTTNGTTCASQDKCANYTSATGCYVGTDGTCIFSYPVGTTTGTKACRVQTCADLTFTTSAACTKAMAGCISNGTACMAQSTCATYTTLEACVNGGGSDGLCAFTPTTSKTVGTCAPFSQCSAANLDSVSCAKKVGACKYTAATSTVNSTCTTATCQLLQSGTNCSPYYSFDLTQVSFCALTNGTCQPVTTVNYTASTCWTQTAGTYTWNANKTTCQQCNTTSQVPNTNNTTNSTNTTTTTTAGTPQMPLLFLAIFALQGL